MSIRCGRDPEAEKIKKKIEAMFLSFWLWQVASKTEKTEDDFIRHMKLWDLSEEEMRYALDRYRKMAYSKKKADEKAEEDAKNAELNKKLEHGCALSLLILFLLIFIPMVIISIAKSSSTIQ